MESIRPTCPAFHATQGTAVKLWPDQELVAAYDGGPVAVMAVPGGGKTTALASIAARLIARGSGEILVVTYQNVAVTNLRQRVDDFLTEVDLPPVGFHVATLHSLAYMVLSEHGERIGFDDEPTVLSEDDATQQFTLIATEHYSQYEDRWKDEHTLHSRAEAEKFRRDKIDFIRHVGRRVTRWIKHHRLDQRDVERVLLDAEDPCEPPALGCWVYLEYQRRLDDLQTFDFDDLAVHADRLLGEQPDITASLQRRWSHILEDEAQDSVPLQEKMLAKLAGPANNWIRVGDSNQSIMGTFTSADPAGFRRFFQKPGVQQKKLRQSARSSPAIAKLANSLVGWTRRRHPVEAIRTLAFDPAEIQVVDDTGQTRIDEPNWSDVNLTRRYKSFENESLLVVDRWSGILQRGYMLTGAVLVPTNRIGELMTDALQKRGIECDQLLESNPAVQNVMELIASAIAFFAQPHRSGLLAEFFERCLKARCWDLEPGAARAKVSAVLRSEGRDLLTGRRPARSPALLADLEEATRFASQAAALLRASILPIDRLIATLVIEFRLPAEIAGFTTGLAKYLGRLMNEHPEYGLLEVANHLQKRRATDLSASIVDSSNSVYRPREGIITVSTYHRAKGLEWDVVYLTGLNEWHFPSDPASKFFEDKYEQTYAIERAIGDLSASLPGGPISRPTPEIEYIAERLRLLYVGITRAKRALSMSSHQFLRAEDEEWQEPRHPTLAHRVLSKYVEETGNGMRSTETPKTPTQDGGDGVVQ